MVGFSLKGTEVALGGVGAIFPHVEWLRVQTRERGYSQTPDTQNISSTLISRTFTIEECSSVIYYHVFYYC